MTEFVSSWSKNAREIAGWDFVKISNFFFFSTFQLSSPSKQAFTLAGKTPAYRPTQAARRLTEPSHRQPLQRHGSVKTQRHACVTTYRLKL